MENDQPMTFEEGKAKINADPHHQATERLPMHTLPDWATDLPTGDEQGKGRALIIRISEDGYIAMWTSFDDPAYTVQVLSDGAEQVSLMMARGLTDG